MSEEREPYSVNDAAKLVRRLADGLSRELAGLNVDAPEAALAYAEDRLGNALQLVRLSLHELRLARAGDEGGE